MRRNRGFVGVSSCVHFLFSSFSLSFERFEVTVLFSSSLDLDGPAFLFSSPFPISFRGYPLRTPPAGVSNKREKNTSLTRPNFAISDTHPITERNGLLIQAKTDVITQSIIFFRSFAFSDYFIKLLSRDRRPSVISFHSIRLGCDRKKLQDVR